LTILALEKNNLKIIHMKIKAILIAGLVSALTITTVSAQEREKRTPQERATMLTERMDKALVLTADQKGKIAELNLGVALKNERIRKDATLTKDKKKEALDANKATRDMNLKMILTPEQYAKVQKMEAKMHDRREERKGEKKEHAQPEELK
jgi:Spy/CpxP family protein refolding chaperone